MKILVTGGAGFIGSHVVDGLVAQGHQVVVLDNLRTGRRENLNPAATFEEMDICSPGVVDVFSRHRPQAVFHLAAQVDVRFSVAQPAEDARINIVGSVNVLEAAKRHGAQYFIFASSGGAIYGDTDVRPTPEKEVAYPVSPYGIGKLAVEHYLHRYGEWMRTVALRYANVYGPRQDGRGEAGVVAIFCDRLLRGQTATIYGDGEQTRDFVYVADVVTANLAALASTVSGEFNIGTGEETSINKLSEMIRSAAGQGSFARGPAKPGEQQHSSLDASKAARTLNWRPQMNLIEGLRRTVSHFSEVQKRGSMK